MQRTVTALVAGLTLVLGFVAAQGTGNRALGGVVLLVGAGWCVLRERRRTAAWRLVVVGAVALGCFAGSHAVADVIGPWPAVLLAATVTSTAAWLFVQPPPQRGSATRSHPSSDAGGAAHS